MHKSLLCFSIPILLCTSAFSQDGWTQLFNGKDLSGWVQRGGNATYTIENGEIVGTAVVDTPNSFLCTKENYGNFIFEMEFKVDPRLNSGVQFRSECFDHASEPKGLDGQPIKNAKGDIVKVPANRVHGYQCEIDFSPTNKRFWTGGIYDESRRGWIYPGSLGGDGKSFTEQGAKITKLDGWNTLKIQADGSSIKTWFNGEPRADIQDALTPQGFFGLQVHAIKKELAGAQVHFRNIRLKQLAPSAAAPASASSSAPNTLTSEEVSQGWRLLWDGSTTKGWRSAKAETFPDKGWVIKDGVLTVLPSGGAESTAGGDIITVERFPQFELMADFKITPGANSGIKYYVQPGLGPISKTGAAAKTGSAIGLEYQILDDVLHPDAKLGLNGDRTIASLYDLIPASPDKKPNPIGEWNTARIVISGNHIEHWLNGQKVVEYERGSSDFHERIAKSKYKNIPGFGEWPEGHILLQDHGNEVSFRNIKIRTQPAK